VNPHANHSDSDLKLARQIEDYWVRTGLVVGLIFLQHHETRTTTDDIVSVKTWTRRPDWQEATIEYFLLINRFRVQVPAGVPK
jgi:hypothetical protein